MPLSDWERFENDCVSYLNQKYGSRLINFYHQGLSDSTTSDIEVRINNIKCFYIEIKSPESQCGQFVCFPNFSSNIFEYSQKNRTPINQYSEKIIELLNSDFENYASEDCRNHPLPDEYHELYADWIIEYYKSKEVEYFITKNSHEYIIFPTDAITAYFQIKATYRVKKSGSSNPSNRDFDIIKDYYSQKKSAYKIEKEGKRTIIYNFDSNDDNINIAENHYYISRDTQSPIGTIRKLSKTYNSNVIFSIRLLGSQREEDLEKFKNSISVSLGNP